MDIWRAHLLYGLAVARSLAKKRRWKGGSRPEPDSRWLHRWLHHVPEAGDLTAQRWRRGSLDSYSKSGGDGWESNPPGTPYQDPTDGFEEPTSPAELETGLKGP